MLELDTMGELLHVRVECGSYLPDWRPNQDFTKGVSARRDLGGGVLLELSHDLDYLQWFFGPVQSVYSTLLTNASLSLEVEEAAELILQTEKGISISVHLDFNSRITRRHCTAQFKEGELTWNAVDKSVRWHSPNCQEEEETFEAERDEVYRRQLEHFIWCIENGGNPQVPLSDGVETLCLIEAVHESDHLEKTVFLT
jgi:predicted dehydrogenase